MPLSKEQVGEIVSKKKGGKIWDVYGPYQIGQRRIWEIWAFQEPEWWTRYVVESVTGEPQYFSTFADLCELLASTPTVAYSDKIFVVHGHAGEAREAVARFIERLGYEPVILRERSNQASTILEKFEAHADVGFAVVLLSPDDLGGQSGGEQSPRARQNVILELGYFMGRLGRRRLCALKVGQVELPSDILGIGWTPFDANDGWKQGLAGELQEAGYVIDWNKAMGAGKARRPSH